MTPTIIKPVVSILFSLALLGCSNKQANQMFYELAQPTPENECQFARPQEKEACFMDARNRIPYEQYESERADIIKAE